jgi:hypothetical protein
VVGEDAQRTRDGEVLPVPASRQLLAELDQGPEVRCLEHRRDVLQDGRHSVEAEPGVDVLRG